jgi:hypothetical protein
MDMQIVNDLLVQTMASLVGVFMGALAALAADRYNVHRRKQHRAQTLLRILTQELTENYETLRAVKSAYQSTPWGKSFYVSTMAWETALAAGDLPEIVGYDLADRLAQQYGWLIRIRYYVELLTRLWFAPREIAGYEDIQRGFRQAIVAAMDKALTGHTELMRHIRQ